LREGKDYAASRLKMAGRRGVRGKLSSTKPISIGCSRKLKAPEKFRHVRDSTPGVLDRIEAQEEQRVKPIWSVFLEPLFGRRLAVASHLDARAGRCAICAGSEFDEGLLARGQAKSWSPRDLRPPVLASDNAEQDKDAVLVNLVTYQEH